MRVGLIENGAGRRVVLVPDRAPEARPPLDDEPVRSDRFDDCRALSCRGTIA